MIPIVVGDRSVNRSRLCNDGINDVMNEIVWCLIERRTAR